MVRRLEARPGPATAHRHRGSSLRRPPHQWGWVADGWLGASVRSLARPRRPRGGLQSGGAWGARACSGLAAAHRHRVSKPALVLPLLTVARCRHCVASPDCVCCASLHAGSLISHVIPLRLFQDLNCGRWYFNVSACCCGVGPIELRAIFLGVGLRLRVGVADPLRETGLPVLVRACVGLKPASPLRARTWLGLKPPSPLRVRIGWFWRVFRLQWCCRFQRLLFKGEHW